MATHGITLTAMTAALRCAADNGDLANARKVAHTIDAYASETCPMWVRFHSEVREASRRAWDQWIDSPPTEKAHAALWQLVVDLDMACQRLDELAGILQAMHPADA